MPVYVEDEYRILQIDRSVAGLISYPFSRAMRVDFSGGGRNIGYKQDITARIYDFNSGQQISQERPTVPSPDDLMLAEGSAALVFDTSIMGATSPIRGSRYRLELGAERRSTHLHRPDRGRPDLSDAGPALHLRVPRSVLTRRYGNDAEDFRLPTLYLGYPGLVRGYA